MKFKQFLAEDQVTFYKAIPSNQLKIGKKIVPGTVTTSYDEAYRWWERYNGKKTKGAAKHIKHQPASIISFKHDAGKLLTSAEFQRAGVPEHERKSSWTSTMKDKAQINEPIEDYKVVLKEPL